MAGGVTCQYWPLDLWLVFCISANHTLMQKRLVYQCSKCYAFMLRNPDPGTFYPALLQIFLQGTLKYCQESPIPEAAIIHCESDRWQFCWFVTMTSWHQKQFFENMCTALVQWMPDPCHASNCHDLGIAATILHPMLPCYALAFICYDFQRKNMYFP